MPLWQVERSTGPDKLTSYRPMLVTGLLVEASDHICYNNLLDGRQKCLQHQITCTSSRSIEYLSIIVFPLPLLLYPIVNMSASSVKSPRAPMYYIWNISQQLDDTNFCSIPRFRSFVCHINADDKILTFILFQGHVICTL